MVTTTLSVTFITILLGHLWQGECYQDTLDFLREGNNYTNHVILKVLYFVEEKFRNEFCDKKLTSHQRWHFSS